jgi:hypothetical protein
MDGEEDRFMSIHWDKTGSKQPNGRRLRSRPPESAPVRPRAKTRSVQIVTLLNCCRLSFFKLYFKYVKL